MILFKPKNRMLCAAGARQDRHISVAELAAAVCPRGSTHPVMALLKAYFDGSFTDRDKPVRVSAIGGYVGSEATWLKVEEEWNANLERWGLGEFRLANILAGRTRVGSADAERCVLSFGRIIGRSGLHGISASLRADDWEQVPKDPQYLASFPKPYHACLHMLLENLAQQMQLEFKDHVVSVVIDVDEAPSDAIKAISAQWLRQVSRLRL